jgi:probable HAF family extracellular repeat protein/T5SS/PEP-CTERM-associated repeat protein
MQRSLSPVALVAVLLSSFGTTRPEASASASAGSQTTSQSAATARYAITDLGTLGGPMTKAMGINDDGLVVGASQSSTFAHAFLWDGGSMTSLGDLGGQGSWAHDIDEAGRVVGGSALSDGKNHAFLWQQSGGMQDLGTLGGPVSFAFGVNDAGHAVGYAWDDAGVQHAVLWGSGGIVDLGDLDPMWPTASAAYGINDAGQVVGNSYTADPSQSVHAFLWQNGAMQDLGTLGGDYSSADTINESGQVVGVSRLADNTTLRAFLWDGSMQDLGALTWTHSAAYDINDNGQVVGALQTGQTSHAFVWADGQMQDLNDLIPSGSGWVLSEAHAINDKGRIVGFGTFDGQTRAFLLEPKVFYWANPSGGPWQTASNWDPKGIPGAGDTVVFSLNGQYAVDTTAPPLASTTEADRVIVEGSSTVDFHALTLNLLADSPEDPALKVSHEGIVNIHSGSGTFIHAAIGALPPANPYNPLPARLQVFNSGTALNGTGRLTIGDEGLGDLFVANGGQLTSAEARLGGLLTDAAGTAVVGGDGSLWQTGNIAVGYGETGALTIENGGRVDSNDAFVSSGVLSEDSHVTIEGVGAGTGQASLWALLGDLTVGQTDVGYVEVLNGGDLYVSQNVHVKNGELNIEGRHANGDPSDLDVLGSVFVGGAGSANLLALRGASMGDIEGDLIIGESGEGAAILWGASNTANPTQLHVVDPQAGLCAVGHRFDGGVSLDVGGLLRCRNIELGGRAGTSGAGWLTVDGGMVRALDVLTVGQVGGGAGEVDMQNNALVATDGTYVTPNGKIIGTGTLAVGFLGLQNDGTLEPTIAVLYPSPSSADFRSTAEVHVDPATLMIDGALTIGPTGRVEIPVIGESAGQYGKLAVTGTAALDGVLEIRFGRGFAPKTGDTFPLLEVGGAVSGAFDSVGIDGLEPGFEYELQVGGGQVTLEALNDGVSLPNRSPVADAGGPYKTYENRSLPLSRATASDPDLDPLTYDWSVDSPECSFDDASALEPRLTCTAIGDFTATLTASDGFTPPATSEALVTVKVPESGAPGAAALAALAGLVAGSRRRARRSRPSRPASSHGHNGWNALAALALVLGGLALSRWGADRIPTNP